MPKKKLPPPPPVVETPPAPPSELEEIEAEMREISPRLKDLKRNDYQEYKKVYRRYMWLVEQRTQRLGGNS